MRLTTLFTLAITLLIGTAEGKSPDLFAPLKLLGIEYTVEKSPDVEGIGKTKAVYHSGTDSIIVSPKGLFESKKDYFQTIIHELVHWSGAREDRAWRAPYVDVYQEEIIAEVVARLLTKHLFEGKFEYSADDLNHYLDTHPQNRQLTNHEIRETEYCIGVAYKYLIILLKKVDTKDELKIR